MRSSSTRPGDEPSDALVKKWIAAPFWQPEEGVALAFAVEPSSVVKSRIYDDPEINLPDPGAHYAMLARRAIENGDLNQQTTPENFIEWAESAGLEFSFKWHAVLKTEYFDHLRVPSKNKLDDDFSIARRTLIRDWILAPTWSLDQGVAFSMNVDVPTKRISLASGARKIKDSQRQEYNRRREFAIKAVRQNQLSLEPTPREFIEWASTVGFPFHGEWIVAIPTPHNEAPASEPSEKRELGSREHETLLKLIAGMVVKKYGYVPDLRTQAISKIVNDMAEIGFEISDDTVRAKVRAGIELLP